ncbi:unnamed protein product [Prunus brigantina]
MQGFRDAIDYCGLQDLGFMGPKFTWWRNNPEDIRVRLDRALANIKWFERFSGMEGLVVDYFQKLFTSNSSTVYDEVVDVVQNRVTVEMNSNLLAEFTTEEIRTTLFQMHPSKAPGPDGLCNVIYKIGAKVLANRLKQILSTLISESQSAFAPGHMISDNSIVAFELLHFMHKKTTGRKGYLALKLDMSKAFDRVEWRFLEALMLGMGFDGRWVNLIMTCLTTVSYSFILNGNPRGLPHGVRLCRDAPLVSHLLFADDSFLFLRANQSECEQLRLIFQHYEAVSGQKINLEKSCVSFNSNIDNAQ